MKKRFANSRVATTSLVAGLCVFIGACHGPNPKPLTITLTCDTHGRLEPCGCFTGQMGGLTRIDTLLGNRRNLHEIRVDAGDAIAGKEDFHRIQYRYMLKAFTAMDFDALNMGLREAALSADELTALATASGAPLISANLYDSRTGQRVLPAYRFFRRGGCRIAVTGIVDNRERLPLGANMEIRDAGTCLDHILPTLKKGADVMILLAFTDEDGMARLANRFYEFDLVLGGDVSQPSQDIQTANRSILWYTTNEARSLGHLRVLAGKDGRVSPVEGRSILVHDRIVQSPRIRRLVEAYRTEIADTVLEVDNPHRTREDYIPGVVAEASFVGSQACTTCHEEEAEIWHRSGHAKAFRTLQSVRADADPTCIPCHVVGFGMPSGYRRGLEAPGVMAVGCESCHGPGSLHIAKHEDEQNNGFVFRPLGAGDCITCHYGEFSRPFDWDAFWPEVAHGKEIGP